MKKRWEVQQQYNQSILNDKFVDFITSSNNDSEKKMSLSFAITLIVAVSTISYRGYTYLQSNAVSETVAFIIIMMFSLSAIILVLLSVFIFLRGFSIELEESTFKSKITSIASELYKSAFIIFALWIPFLVAFCVQLCFTSGIKSTLFMMAMGSLIGYAISSSVLSTQYSLKCVLVFIFRFLLSYKFHVICFIVNIFFIFFAYNLGLIGFFGGLIIAFLPPFLYFIFERKYIVAKYAEYIVCALSGVISVILIIVVILCGMNYVLTSQSHINIEMADSYNKNDAIISGSLKVFGVNEVMNLNLSKIYSNNTIETIDSVVLESTPDSMSKGDILFCSYLNNGEYSIYLNMSNQSSGYYKLSTDTGDSMKQASKVFFLE